MSLPDALQIRPATEADLPALLALAERTFREAWADDNDPENFERYCREAFNPARLAAEFADPRSEFYLVLRAELPVAYLKLNLHTAREGLDGDDHLQIERIYVLAEYQGQRLGGRLLELALERAAAVGAPWLWLSVWQEAPRSIRFYQRNGFEIFGTGVFQLGDDPQTDWLMKRRVPREKISF
jgi:ribosomal protein S18 acetylase RimI-like enzyme